ncbi:MAG: tRNA-guanine transglycosylase [SAR324 cluster bacterium]|nr:tRNA-guanine transglycosylase [SAR324 cluster bacterium]
MTGPRFNFQVQHTDGGARAGELETPHGKVLTPFFMPVATQATVKGLTPEEVKAAGAQIILSNAYHLYLRPGVETVRKMGGLHKFMGWDGPILTDSGGFQAFSMGPLRKVTDDGIRFRSHIDGSEHNFTPQLATANQEGLGADIVMCFDQCIAYGASEKQVRQAMERTHRWAQACFDAHQAHQKNGAGNGAATGQALFGIVQGGTIPELRDESARAISAIPFHSRQNARRTGTTCTAAYMRFSINTLAQSAGLRTGRGGLERLRQARLELGGEGGCARRGVGERPARENESEKPAA